MAERNRLPLWIPVLLAVGIGVYFGLPTEPPPWAGAAAFAVSCCFTVICRKSFLFRLAGVAFCLMALGFTAASLRTQMASAPALYSTLYFRTIQGVVDDIQARKEGERIVLRDVAIERLSPHSTPWRVSLTFRRPVEGLKVGDRVEASAILFPPPTPSMPGAHDFSRHYYYDRIGAVGFAPRPPEVIGHVGQLEFKPWLTQLRLSLGERVMAAMSGENGAVAAALMVGEKSGVSEEVRQAMRDAGLYHVLAISGLHMSLAVGLLYIGLRFLFSLCPPLAIRLPAKKIAAVVGLAGGLAYVLLAGHPVSAVRSFIMVACVMLAILLDRRGISLYALAWAASLILLAQPEALVGVSFQLSFAATLAIVAFYERYAYLLHAGDRGMWHRMRLYFLGLMATSLVATLATTPLVIYHFNRFTLWGVAANMLMMPLASFVIMPSALLAFLLMPFGLEAVPLYCLDQGIGWMIAGARLVAAMPFAAVAVSPPTSAGMVMAVAGGLWLCLMAGRWRMAGIAAVALGMCSIALHQPYDLMISNDGGKVALRMENGRFTFLKGRASSYDGQAWLRYHGQQEEGAHPASLSPAAGKRCDGQWCMVASHGRRIAVADGKEGGRDICGISADIVITPNYVRDHSCLPEALVFDRLFLLRQGAVGLRFREGGIAMEVAEDGRRGRPWSSEAHYRLYHYDREAITDK